MGIKFRLIVMNFLQYAIWGSWLISLGAYLGRWPRLHRAANRKFLCHDGRCVVVHARSDGYHCRPVDPGAEAARHLPSGERRVPDCRGFANGLWAFIQLYAAERDVLHADHRPVEFGGIQCPRPGKARYRETFSPDPRVGYRRFHRRDVVRRPDAYRRRADQADRVAALCFGGAVVPAGRLLVLAARLPRRPHGQGQVVGRYAGAACVHALQGEAHGHFASSSRCCSAPRCR